MQGRNELSQRSGLRSGLFAAKKLVYQLKFIQLRQQMAFISLANLLH
jgi:hypothetical protein